MNSPPRASGSIIAAGISAVLAGIFGIFSTLAILILFSTPQFARSAPFPPALRPILYGVWIFLLLCALFIVITGIQVIRLRNWARLSLLVIAGCLLCFGLLGIVVIFVSIFVSTPSDPRVSQALLASILALIYGIPIAISLWWLLLFTRRSVTAQFQALAALEAPRPPSTLSFLNNPDCPLGIRVVAWYLASFVLILPFLPFVPIRLPAFFFGHLFQGAAATGIYFLNFALLIIPGFGLLLLKRWSYPFAYASQLLICANGLSSVFSPSYENAVRSMLSEMNSPEVVYGADQMLHLGRYFSLFALSIPIAILITLFLSRRKFYEAADRASQISAA